MCDCGERLESLSGRVERLESAAKSKDVDSPTDTYSDRPIWVIDPNGTQVSTGTGKVTISSHDGIRISSGTTFQWSDNMQWHTSAGTGKVLISRDAIVAEISRRANQWTLQADDARRNGKDGVCRRYNAIATALACLADDIESGALDNE